MNYVCPNHGEDCIRVRPYCWENILAGDGAIKPRSYTPDEQIRRLRVELELLHVRAVDLARRLRRCGVRRYVRRRTRRLTPTS